MLHTGHRAPDDVGQDGYLTACAADYSDFPRYDNHNYNNNFHECDTKLVFSDPY